MAYEQKPNRGSLFRNTRKETETHPDYTGDINIDGKLYWLNGWLEESKAGTKYFSLSVKPKDAPKSAPVKKSFDDTEELLSDDIPF